MEDAAAMGDALMAFVTLQLIVLVFTLFAWSRTLLRLRDHEITPMSFILWSCVWVGISLVGVLAGPSRALAEYLGIARPVDVFVYGSIVVLLYMVFRMHVRQEGLRHETTLVVRSLAMMNPKRKK